MKDPISNSISAKKKPIFKTAPFVYSEPQHDEMSKIVELLQKCFHWERGGANEKSDFNISSRTENTRSLPTFFNFFHREMSFPTLYGVTICI